MYSLQLKATEIKNRTINSIFLNNGFDKATVELIKSDNNELLCNERNETNGNVDLTRINSNNIKAQFHLRYEYDLNTYAHMWIKDININCV